MNKPIILGFIISTFLTSTAFAKTEGNYVGLNIIRTTVEEGESKLDGLKTDKNFFETGKESKVSVGVDYKYAFNINNFYLAPMVFFDYTNISMSNKNISQNVFDLDYRIGTNLEAGYDITDKLSAFVSLGLVSNRYTLTTANGSKTDSDGSALAGFGVKYSLIDNIDANIKYEISEYTVIDDLQNEVEFDVNVLKLGISYKF